MYKGIVIFHYLPATMMMTVLGPIKVEVRRNI